MSDAIRVERAGTVATLWLDHPPVNAMTIRMLHDLQAALADLGARALELSAHPDAQEGMDAVLQKRIPGFRDG